MMTYSYQKSIAAKHVEDELDVGADVLNDLASERLTRRHSMIGACYGTAETCCNK